MGTLMRLLGSMIVFVYQEKIPTLNVNSSIFRQLFVSVCISNFRHILHNVWFWMNCIAVVIFPG
jgi:hypothetical protein